MLPSMRKLFGFRSQHAKDKVLAVIKHTIPWYLAFQMKQQIHNNKKKTKTKNREVMHCYCGTNSIKS